MTTAEARQLVQKTFQNPFDKGQFVYFIKNLVNEIDESKAFHARGYVHEKYRDRVKTYERVGTYTDPEDNKIDILIVYLQKESSIDRARTTLRNFVGDYLKERGEKEAGLIAFVSPNQKDWRFSLVKMEYKITETPNGRIKAKEEFTPAKRYSFLVGVEETSHTAQSRLVPILEDDKQNPTLKQIEEAFNIEKVTKEFFEKYRDLYLRVKETLDEVLKKDKAIKADFDAKNINTVDFGKKLLGQIVFLYFLQKKGWFGVKRDEAWGSGSKNFLRELFDKKHGDYKNFFNDTLEPLFYEALRNDRSHDDHYFSMFKCKIPFLNGGLFDPINNYDWKETDIILPNDLFSNSYKTKEGDEGTGILDIFDRYNFTVKEDEPLEKEVAVDPEMLGKVFENLLEIKDRKSKGTYYTPREIVHYMCQESLVNYLATELDKKVSKKDIETLIKYGEGAIEHDATSVEKKSKDPKYKSSYYKPKLPKSIEKHAKLIDEKLETIRICDPAVGSGAFPVGMMNEIIRTRNALTSYLKIKKGRTIYDFKRHAIQNCLYGVDIDLGAVEIAKLRLWLSLIVDEEDIKQIKPLPNLDYKIMQGNSLIELISYTATSDQKRNEVVNQQKKLKDELFSITSPEEKKKRRDEIDNVIRQLFEYDRNLIIDDLRQKIKGIQNQGRLFTDAKFETEDKKRIEELEDKIEEVQKIKIPGASEHFEWHINFSEIFQEKNGFDVVIANPPYVSYYSKQAQPLSQKEMDFYKRNYDFILNKKKRGRFGTVMFFLEKGVKTCKQSGALTYIIDMSIFENPYFDIRKFLTDNFLIKEIVIGLTGFEEVHSGQILLRIQKRVPDNNSVVYKNSNFDLITKFDQDELVKNGYKWNIYDRNVITEKIERGSKLLSELFPKRLIRTGITFTGKKEEFIVSEKNQGKYKIIPQNIYNLYEGAGAFRFPYEAPKSTEKINYDLELVKKLNKAYVAQNKTDKNPMVIGLGDLFVFKNPRILIRLSDVRITATYTKDIACSDLNLYSISNTNSYGDNSLYNLKFILALLNSKLMTYYALKKKLIALGERKTPQIRLKSLKFLPIRLTNDQDSFVEPVDKTLTITKDNDYLEDSAKQAKVREYEKQIDQLVYKLYGLTTEEIKIVENGK